jgi:hypothetical protein
MAFTIYATAPIETGSQTPYDDFETYDFDDHARYEILPSGVLLVDKLGDGTCWVLSRGRWQWVRAAKHPPGEVGKTDGQLGAEF